MINTPVINWSKEKILLSCLLFIGVAGGVFAFPLKYFSNSNVLIGLCLLPFSIFITGPKRNNILYLGLIFFFAALAVTYKVRIFYFFTLAFYVLWLMELLVGKINSLVLFLVVFMSPFFIQVVTILGFPLRLMLSGYAGSLLKYSGVNVQVEGNMMIVDNAFFSVDEACMGLNMLVISMLMGVFILAFRFRVEGKTFGLYTMTLFFLVVFILNLVTNVFRILVLVYFRIPAEHVMHEFAGIICLVLYVLIPLHFASLWIISKYGKKSNHDVSQPGYKRSRIILLATVALTILFTGANTNRKRGFSNFSHSRVKYGDNQTELLSDGISKITTKDLLIYVKVIPEFFTGEHTPLLCWKGSGYDFAGITTTRISGVTIYKGTLVNDGKSLHTAWWYSNGQVATISQLDWRTRMLKGENGFCLVNITAEDEQTLVNSINTIFTTNSLLINS